MTNFDYYAPTKVVFGKGTEDQAGDLVREQGATKVLVHYGSGSVKRSGLLERIYQSLEQAGIPCVSLGGVQAHYVMSVASRILYFINSIC